MRVGVDLGGTKIEAIVLDDQGQPCWRERVSTPHSSYEETLVVLSDLVFEAKFAMGLDVSSPVGVGTPGALSSSTKVMKNCNSTCLNGRSLPDDLAQRLQCQVYLENDANCFALAETLFGQGKRLFARERPESVFGIILGTGVGAGVVVRDVLLKGRHAISGEWGHNPLPASELNKLPVSEKKRSCYCGRKDCIETYLSGPGLALSYRLRFKEKSSPQMIIAKMREQDSQANEVWRVYLTQLASALASVINILDPSLIVVGGGLSNIGEIYAELPRLVAPYVFSDSFNTPIVPAVLGDSAGVYGAAWLAP